MKVTIILCLIFLLSSCAKSSFQNNDSFSTPTDFELAKKSENESRKLTEFEKAEKRKRIENDKQELKEGIKKIQKISDYPFWRTSNFQEKI